jgi:hypothetical protein
MLKLNEISVKLPQSIYHKPQSIELSHILYDEVEIHIPLQHLFTIENK